MAFQAYLAMGFGLPIEINGPALVFILAFIPQLLLLELLKVPDRSSLFFPLFPRGNLLRYSMMNEEDRETNPSSAEDDPTACVDRDENKCESVETTITDGCTHYVRRCKLVCPDCNQAYWCRHCHDAEMDKETDPKKHHNLDRSRVTAILCGVCQKRQAVSAFCSNAQCGITFGDYTCTRCPFYDDRVERQYYHCDACGICRVGGRENFFHCPTCDGCFAKSMENNHTCVEQNLKQNCPVCFEYQFDSVRPNAILRCGHTIHVHCLEQLEENITGVVPTCPICKKSIGDYSQYWKALDREIDELEVPAEYAGWRATVDCNDCSATTADIPFNLVALKCAQCGSYNTSRLSIVQPPEGQPFEEER